MTAPSAQVPFFPRTNVDMSARAHCPPELIPTRRTCCVRYVSHATVPAHTIPFPKNITTPYGSDPRFAPSGNALSLNLPTLRV